MEPNRLTYTPPNAARAGREMIAKWTSAVRVQAQRLTEAVAAEPPTASRTAVEADFYVIALRNLTRAVHYVAEKADAFDWPGPIRQPITEARIAFVEAFGDEKTGDLKSARDALQHFDQYADHVGNLKSKDLTALLSTGPMYGDDLDQPRYSITVSIIRPADEVPAPGTTNAWSSDRHVTLWLDEVEQLLAEYIPVLLTALHAVLSAGTADGAV